MTTSHLKPEEPLNRHAADREAGREKGAMNWGGPGPILSGPNTTCGAGIPPARDAAETAAPQAVLSGPLKPDRGAGCRLPLRNVAKGALATILAASCLSSASLAQIVLRDVTDRTGITFRHSDGSSGKRYIVESVASGLATFDYDGDGLIDIYFLSGRPLGPPGSDDSRTRGPRADAPPAMPSTATLAASASPT